MVDFSYWAVVLVVTGTVIKYLFTDFMTAMQRKYEKTFATEGGYGVACWMHPLISKLMPFDKYALAENYAETNYKFGRIVKAIGQVTSLVVLIFCAYPHVMKWLNSVEPFASNPVLTLIATSIIVDLVFSVIDIPFNLYDTFVIEKKFGFNNQTVGCWLSDFGKSFVIDAVFSAVTLAFLYYGILCFTKFSGFSVVSVSFIATIISAQFLFGLFWESVYINVIAPMFNKFTPIKEGALKDRIMALITDAGYSVSGIYVMDAGRRSKHSNAYFTGWGRNKRIVLYDTLLNSHNEDEILAILGHEVGHLVHGDILRGRIVDTIWSAVRTTAIMFLISDVRFYHAFGFDFVDPSNITHWYIAGWWFANTVLSSVEWVMTPMWNMLSRKNEYAADKWSADHIGANSMSNALVRLHIANLGGMHDHPFFEFWYYGHPGLRNRLNALKHKI